MKSKRDVIKERLRGQMLLFGRVCLPNMFSVKSPPFHAEISALLSDPLIRKLNIIAPRGHAKSSLVGGLFPLYHLFFDEGQKFIVLVSKTEGHASRLLQTIKNALEYSEPLQAIFGYHGEHVAKVWQKNEIVLDTNDMLMCRGTGQQVVGLKYGDQRPTLVILDDPEDMNNTKTAEAMEHNLRWLLQALLPSLDPLRGRIAVIGTPQHERCIVETLKSTEGWASKHYKAIQDDGSALWPEWMSLERLEEEKRSYESINRVASFYREYQCQIIGDEDQLFREEYFRYYEGTFEKRGDDKFLHLTSFNSVLCDKWVPITVFLGIDPASSTAKTADYSVIFPLAIDEDRNRYVLPYFRSRVSPLKLAEKIMEYAELYSPERTRIESVGYQEMLREYIREKTFIPGMEIKENPRSPKSVRLEALEPFFAQGKVYMQPTMRELRDELLLYPRGKNDDLLDGFFYANKNVWAPSPATKSDLEEGPLATAMKRIYGPGRHSPRFIDGDGIKPQDRWKIA